MVITVVPRILKPFSVLRMGEKGDFIRKIGESAVQMQTKKNLNTIWQSISIVTTIAL